MPSIDKALIELWVQRLFELQNRFRELRGSRLTQKLGAPASDRDIAGFEEWLGYQLPPSYRMFLGLHNGWERFKGDGHLLSIEQQRTGQYAEWIRTLKSEEWAEGSALVLEGLIIGIRLNSPNSFILDTTARDKRNEMEIVLWEYEEIARYSDFLDLLQKQSAIVEQAIAREEEKIRAGDGTARRRRRRRN
jgi:hypothetical protein